MREDILIPILKTMNGNIKEINKVTRFVKSCDYFKGRRRKAYKLIIRYKGKGGKR